MSHADDIRAAKAQGNLAGAVTLEQARAAAGRAAALAAAIEGDTELLEQLLTIASYFEALA